MKIICISASNTKLTDERSTSVRVCNIMKDIIQKEIKGDIQVEVIALRDYDMKPCNLCGECFKSGKCIMDKEFNRLLNQIVTAHGIFLVVPHYSPIPSKLLMILEKINELSYAGWINNNNYQSPFYNMPVGIIGHGGMVEDENTLAYYHDQLVTPVANSLRSLSFKIVSMDEKFKNGVCFGLKDDTCIQSTTDSVFPDIIQDWNAIEERIYPFVRKAIEEISN